MCWRPVSGDGRTRHPTPEKFCPKPLTIRDTTMAPHQIGIIGLGKIAQDQHLPVIKANPNFELLAVSSTRGLSHEDAKYAFQDYRDLLKIKELEAVAICTPPQVRHQIAREALLAGKSVLLEKPP